MWKVCGMEHGERFARESRAKPVKSKGSWVRYYMGTGSIERFPMGVMMLDVSYSISEMNGQLRWSRDEGQKELLENPEVVSDSHCCLPY